MMAQYFFPVLNTHASIWVIAMIFFILSIVNVKKDNKNLAGTFQMILRLFFVFLIVTGLILVYIHNFQWITVVKALLAILLIGIMEILVSRISKNELTSSQAKVFWGLFAVTLIVVLYLGYIVI